MKEQHKKESPVLSLLGMGGGGTGTALGGLTSPKKYAEDVFSTFLYTGTGNARSINNGIELGSTVGVSLNGKTITDTAGGGADYSKLINNIFSSNNTDFYYGSIDCYIDYGSAVVSTFYDLAPQGDHSIGAVYNTPTSITGYGSNNASSWTSLGAVSFTAGDWAEGKFTSYNFSNTTAYRYYRLTVSGTKSLQEWRLGITDSSLGKGGLVWIKNRDNSGQDHVLNDTERGAGQTLRSDSANAQFLSTARFSAFSSNGFSVGTDSGTNNNNEDFASWTFRKAPGFFDIVTWSGDGNGDRYLSHNLKSVPGFVIVKKTSGSMDWGVYHRELGTAQTNGLELNTTVAAGTGGNINPIRSTPTSTQMYIRGGSNEYNDSGSTYVAYIFAHDDASFGTDGDESIIKCGNYTSNGSEQAINLGFEPQFVLIKSSSHTGGWYLFDSMRGIFTGQSEPSLQTQESNAEAADNNGNIALTATGFRTDYNGGGLNNSGRTYIYMAVRRPHKPPEAGTEVFDDVAYTGLGAANTVSFSPTFADLIWIKNRVYGYPFVLVDRLHGSTRYVSSDTNGGQANLATADSVLFDRQESFKIPGPGYSGGQTNNGNAGYNSYISWIFKRAPGFFDAVAYSGNSTNRTISHNLESTPEMMIVKCRSDQEHWRVYVASIGATKALRLDSTSEAITQSTFWNDTAPTSSVFSVGTDNEVNGSTKTYIAYLYATLPGISKVGSYSGTGNAINIPCGFTNGARFVLIKRSDTDIQSTPSSSWYVWDSVRGIVSGNDPYLLSNSNAVEVTNTDYIDPLTSGFTVTASAPAALNASGGTYIFLAIA